MDPGPVPDDCTRLTDAFERQTGQRYQVIGVCVDFLDPVKSRGSDYTMRFKLWDDTWDTYAGGYGMSFRVFKPNITQLPPIQEQGDVVILRNFTTKSYGETFGLSNHQSRWVVLPSAALATAESLQEMHRQARWPGQNDPALGRQANMFSESEFRYAKWLADKADPTHWPPLLGSTKLQRDYIKSSNGGNTSSRDWKFRLIKDLEAPLTNKASFAELLGEVRKIYCDDHKTELYLTDYTTNDRLYDYRYTDGADGGREGDPFGYIGESSSKWAGPWGKMTMSIVLWDPHSAFARDNVKEGTLVYLRNVKIKLDNNGSRLEGCCHGDRSNPTKVNVEVKKPYEAQGDERLKALLMRKRDYEAKAKAENVRFIHNAQQVQKRPHEGTEEQRSKKTKTRNRKKKENRAKTEAEQTTAASEKPLNKLNGNIRCENHNVPCKTIVDILDPDVLLRETAKGTVYRLPFQNCRYKANVKVVDFFPDDIADFAAPRKVSQYDCLSDDGAVEDSDDDPTQVNGYDVKWEWRFILLVEDARQQIHGRGQPARMELLVANTDGDYLLDMEACNLRDPKNAQELAKVKEKLFLLWGDLLERKEEAATAERANVKPSARPFQCLIKEYGVPIRSPGGRSKDGLSYDRIFGLFGTTI